VGAGFSVSEKQTVRSKLFFCFFYKFFPASDCVFFGGNLVLLYVVVVELVVV